MTNNYNCISFSLTRPCLLFAHLSQRERERVDTWNNVLLCSLITKARAHKSTKVSFQALENGARWMQSEREREDRDDERR